MPRRKKFLSIKLPFLKKIKINKNTFANVIGLLIIGGSIISFLSFIQSGEILTNINSQLTTRLGIMAILFPIFLLLAASHFFGSKKVKFIKPHVTIGFLLIFVSLLGFFNTGQFGSIIAVNLRADFSLIGAYFISFLILVVGIILFFNTSIDIFLIMVLESIKKLIRLVAAKAQTVSKKTADDKNERPGKGEFITNRPTVIKPAISQQVLQGKPSSNINIRPLTGEATKDWAFPPLSLLETIKEQKADAGDVAKSSDIIERTLDSFGIRARVVEINRGPTVTQYALEIVMGTKLSKITSLTNDLALALAAPSGQVRIEAPIPGRSLVSVEIPNHRAETVTLKRMLTTDQMSKDPHPLVIPMGLDVSGKPVVGNIARMPHILVAGTTGSGKSVLLNAWICSLLFRTRPQDLRLILVDPKRVELTGYNGIPHLLTEVIVEPEKIISALKWTVAEMENRYKMFAKSGARNIESYNSKKEHEPVPYIIFIIDELADLMIYAPGEAEENITRIAQMARATGIHLILATQRPSVDVITGLMKANIPSRIAFNVASLVDSRVVLDMPGAEKLIGRGDMLYLPADQAKPKRIQGPYMSEKDVTHIVDFLKQKAPAVEYTEEVTEQESTLKTGGKAVAGTRGGGDPLLQQAIDLVYQAGKASASLIQRRLSVGYARAARILDQLEEAGYVGPAQGSKPREIITRTQSKEETSAQDMQDELKGIH